MGSAANNGQQELKFNSETWRFQKQIDQMKFQNDNQQFHVKSNQARNEISKALKHLKKNNIVSAQDLKVFEKDSKRYKIMNEEKSPKEKNRQRVQTQASPLKFKKKMYSAQKVNLQNQLKSLNEQKAKIQKSLKKKKRSIKNSYPIINKSGMHIIEKEKVNVEQFD